MNLIGCGSHGQDIEAIWERVGDEPLFGYDDDPATGLPSPVKASGDAIFGINNPTARKELVKKYTHLSAAPPLIDPSAVVGWSCWLGDGVVVAPHAVILRSVTLYEHVHVNYGASMTRCLIGAYSTVAPGATICGDVVIGEECYIGANATICDRVTIGNNVTIGAGAIIPPLSTVPDNTTVIGVWKQ